jgi:small-conductance mechanosensitive channel
LTSLAAFVLAIVAALTASATFASAAPPSPETAAVADTATALSPAERSREASPAPDEESFDPGEPAGYPVRVGDRELYRLTAPDRARTPEERARVGTERFTRFARGKRSVDPVRVERAEDGADVYLGDLHLFTVFHVDTVDARKDILSLARERAGLVRTAVIEYREERGIRSVAIAGLIAVLATIGFLLVWRGIGALHRRARARVQTWVTAREEGIRRRTAAVVRGSHLLLGMNGIVDGTRAILVFLACFLYLHTLLAAFPWTRSIAQNMDDMLVGPLTTIGRSFLDALPGLVFIAVVFVIVRYALHFLRFLALEIEAGRIDIPGFYGEWAKPTYTIVRVLVIFFSLVVCYPYIPGSDTEAFKGVSIFLGVLLSLGSTSAVSNLVAGFVLTYMRAFRVGDMVRVDEDRGMVVEVTHLATRIRSPKNEIITIPNATVLGSRITNYTRMAEDPGLILHARVAVGYAAPWRQVHALLLQAAERTSHIQKDPPPFILQTGLEQVQVVYELNAYTDAPERMLRTYSELHQNIQDAFNEYGVQIMTPFYEGDKEAPLVVPKERWYASPAKMEAKEPVDAASRVS